jgi:hypothetical protein
MRATEAPPEVAIVGEPNLACGGTRFPYVPKWDRGLSAGAGPATLRGRAE